MFRSAWFTVAAALALAGCKSTPHDVHGSTPDMAEPPPPDVRNWTPPDVRGCWNTGCAIVTTSHYNADFSGVGTINAVQISQSKIVKNLDSSLDPDVALDISSSDKLYVLNRAVGSLRRYDLAKIAIEQEIATGSSAAPNTLSSPFSFWRSDTSTKIYVTLAGNDSAHALGIVDDLMPNAGVTKFIAVPAAASDSDGKPELSSLYSCKGKLYALSQSYTLMGAAIRYAEGRIAVIDLGSDTLSGLITLAGKNPSSIVQDGDDCNKVLVATSSDLTTPPDGTGGIERVDLAARTTQGFVVPDTDLQGRPFSITKVSSQLAYVGMYFDPQPDATGKIVLGSAKVIAWNPSTATTLGDATGKAGFINFVQLGNDNKLYIGVGAFAGMSDPSKLAQGLYIGKSDGTMLGTTPIDLGDTPSAIAFQR